MPNTYDTPLSEEQRKQFNAWIERESRKQGRDLRNDMADYDLQGWWLDNNGKPSPDGHFTDKFKKPNHPTFSTESIYSSGKKIGGKWSNQDGKDVYTPSLQMLGDNPEQVIKFLSRYFAQVEPTAKLQLPVPYNERFLSYFQR
jgi:hypothetical protein